MLFDLRGRGRRRTVQVIYLGLAVLMFGGLVLFGVGAGNGFGGLLNAFTGNGSSTAAVQYVSQQAKNAQKLTVQQPNNPAAWAALAQARAYDAGQGSNYDVNTGNYTAAGKKAAQGSADAYARYLALQPHPDSDLRPIDGGAHLRAAAGVRRRGFGLGSRDRGQPDRLHQLRVPRRRGLSGRTGAQGRPRRGRGQSASRRRSSS